MRIPILSRINPTGRRWLAWLILFILLAAVQWSTQLLIDRGWITVGRANTVTAVAVDRKGNVWAADFRNVLYLRDPDGNWHSFTPDNSDIPRMSISALAIDSQDHLWISDSGHGIGVFRPDGTWQGQTLAKLPGSALSLAAGTDGSLWIGTTGGLAKFDPGRELTNYTGAIKARQRLADSMPAVAVDDSGRVWVAASGGLGFLDVEGKWKTVTTELRNIRGVAPEPSGHVWVASPAGLLLISENGSVLQTYDQTNSPYSAEAHDIKLDEHGKLWIANGDQLDVFDPSASLPGGALTILSFARALDLAALAAMVLIGMTMVIGRARPAPAPTDAPARSALGGIWIRWTFWTSISWTVGQTFAFWLQLGQYGSRLALVHLLFTPFGRTGGYAYLTLPWALLGLIVGIGQWSVVRRYKSGAIWWIVTCVAGAIAMYALLALFLYPVTIFLGFGLVCGLLETPLLRPSRIAIAWPVVSTVAWAAAGAVRMGLPTTDTPTLEYVLIISGIPGLVGGATSGLGLDWILSSEHPKNLKNKTTAVP